MPAKLGRPRRPGRTSPPACEIPPASLTRYTGIRSEVKISHGNARPPHTRKSPRPRTGHIYARGRLPECFRTQAFQCRTTNAQRSTRQRPQKNQRFRPRDAEKHVGVKPVSEAENRPENLAARVRPHLEKTASGPNPPRRSNPPPAPPAAKLRILQRLNLSISRLA